MYKRQVQIQIARCIVDGNGQLDRCAILKRYKILFPVSYTHLDVYKRQFLLYANGAQLPVSYTRTGVIIAHTAEK